MASYSDVSLNISSVQTDKTVCFQDLMLRVPPGYVAGQSIIKLSNFQIMCGFPNLQKDMSFRITELPPNENPVQKQVLIPAGMYSAHELAQALQDALRSASIWAPNAPYTVTFDSDANKFTIATAANHPFALWSQSQLNNNPSTYTADNIAYLNASTLAKIMGFDGSPTGAITKTSTKYVDISGIDFIYVCCNWAPMSYVNTDSKIPLLAKVPITVLKNEIQNYEGPSDGWVMSTNVQNILRIQLLQPDLTPLPISGESEWSATIHIRWVLG